ncbi:hypothetical protein E2C01_059652 [Portunus trituberculatus]|uniref:Uncharacterized protein n=1 Tax=Portunus trituberculatus TaxID=210409 RepID=A0A5B7H8D7_PORTR|nr:hypothetical protein [Portunus trituberculatus]
MVFVNVRVLIWWMYTCMKGQLAKGNKLWEKKGLLHCQFPKTWELAKICSLTMTIFKGHQDD